MSDYSIDSASPVTLSSHRTRRSTYSSNVVEQALLRERALQARLVALLPAAVAAAHGRPGPVDVRAAAAEEQIIIEFILLYCRSTAAYKTRRSAFNGQNHRGVVGCCEDMSSEAVCIWLPPKWIRL